MVNTRIVPSSRDIAVLGDSIASNNNNTPLTGLQSRAIGFMAQARAIAMGRFNFTPDLNFGVSGDTTTLLLARSGASSLSSLIARRPARVCLIIGTNDVAADVAAATIWTNILTILNTLNGNGIPVDIVPILPRTNSINSARRQTILWLKQKALAERANRLQRLYCVVPLDEAIIDRASATGGFVTGAILDGLHPAIYGAMLMGRMLATHYSSIFPEVPVLGGLSQADVYDATNNPLGALNSSPVPVGTGGSAGTGASGNVASNYSVARTLGSALTLTCSKTTLTDENGGVVQDIAIGGSGGVATENGIFSAGSSISVPAGLSAGQKVVAECDVETISVSALKAITLTAVSSIAGEANDLRLSTTAGEKELPSVRRLLRTPPITLTTPGTETVNMFMQMSADCSGSAPSGTVRIRSMVLRALP